MVDATIESVNDTESGIGAVSPGDKSIVSDQQQINQNAAAISFTKTETDIKDILTSAQKMGSADNPLKFSYIDCTNSDKTSISLEQDMFIERVSTIIVNNTMKDILKNTQIS